MGLTGPGAARLAARFGVELTGSPARLPGGHINDTYLVAGRGEAGPGRYLLQRLNPEVFPAGRDVIENGVLVALHLEAARSAAGLSDAAWRVPRPFVSEDGEAGLQDESGAWWRLFPYLEGTHTLLRATSPAAALEIGRAYGTFHALMASYDGPALRETIPGFHDTPRRYARFEQAVAAAPAGRRRAGAESVAFARAHASWATLLATASLPARVVHNDAKAANVLLDDASGRAVAVIDLDTVMMGTLLSDVGDLLRSTAGTAEEDAGPEVEVAVDRGLFAGLVSGFVAGLGRVRIDPGEWERFVVAGIVISYEQGLRFLADYLEGDRYYRTSRPGQNLDRARTQLRLAAALAADRPDLERVVADLR